MLLDQAVCSDPLWEAGSDQESLAGRYLQGDFCSLENPIPTAERGENVHAVGATDLQHLTQEKCQCTTANGSLCYLECTTWICFLLSGKI